MAIKEAIARGARRQVRGALTPLRRDVRRLRQSVRDLRVQLDRLRDIASRWEASASSQGWQPAVSEEEAQAARLSPGLIRKLRGRLRLSQAAVARLVGVSPAAVVQWEQGRSAPAGKNRAMLVGLRRLGRRQIRRILASLPDGAAPGRPAGRDPAGPGAAPGSDPGGAGAATAHRRTSTPHATRAPELPAGSVRWSSSFSWITMALPSASNTERGPSLTVTRLVRAS